MILVVRDIIIGAGSALIAAAVGAVFFMWRDIAVIKRDIDGIADVLGTTRAKARRKPAE
jgi:hypothetical protein